MKCKSNEVFSKYVFSDAEMKNFLKKEAYENYIKLKTFGGEMSFALADEIAKAMMKWAISLGATHYTHWFSPLTGKSAEKQVSFIDFSKSGTPIDSFNAKCLIKGETDASSFPNGGERMTFEARGYTVWDYLSPVFIKQDSKNNKVLYIPTAFCSYNGVALDEKTPLLRAMNCLNVWATKVANLLGYNEIKSVITNVGAEQEYFLVDKNLASKRKDIMFTGRTLLGAKPTKSQDLYHHYLGEINDKISTFMHELDEELWKVGVMAKIQHNEVAPAQHEVVPVFDQVNTATDQNNLLMELLSKVADRNNLKVLLHEKPFAGINGSGKHNNWSISSNDGRNLLDINKTPFDLFMTMFVSVISAIDNHYDLVRLTTASSSNDHRLGGDEAPPSIISVFIGENMDKILDDYLDGKISTDDEVAYLAHGTPNLPTLRRDNCDRNRTSPFAFTGNKFEFRMVGSMQSNALPNFVLCTIIAKELKKIANLLENCEENERKSKLNEILKHNINSHRRIIFNGNGYDEEWKIEAEKRGLKDYKNSPDCFVNLLKEQNISLFEEMKVLSKNEMALRYDIYLKTYVENVMLEARVLLDMINKEVLPLLCDYYAEVSSIVETMSKIKSANNYILEKHKFIDETILAISESAKTLEDAMEKDISKLSELDKAKYVRDDILCIMKKVREVYDEAEKHLPEKYIAFPTYNDLLF